MSATQPIDPPAETGEDPVKRQLEALANGECDHIAFLDAMKERFRFEPDENWEVLSMLDQYHRRGKIPADVYRAIKNGFAEYILGPQVAMPTLFAVATPAPAPPQPAAPRAWAKPTAPAPNAAVASPTATTKAVPAAARVAAAPVAPAPVAPAPVAPAPAAATRVAAPPVAAPTAAAASAPVLTPAHTFTGNPPSQASAAARTSAAPVREVGIDDVLRDRYRIEALVARGSSGTIYEVSDAYRLSLPPDGKRLAMKVPRTPDPRGNFASQLRHEFQELQHLSHPNIVRAFDFDRDGAISFFTMELLSGVHLPRVLQAKGTQLLQRPHALAIIRDVGSAIAYAHSRGVVHGDVNPQNVFITMAGEVRLLGFGAAHKLSAAMPAPEFERDSPASDTHRYASCEVFEGNRPTIQDDIYSLSCLAYLLLKGKHPYAGTTSIEVRATRMRPRQPAGLNYHQWRTLRAGLSTDASKRPDSVQQWLDAMALDGAAPRLPSANELIEARSGKPRGLGLLAAAAVIAALIGVGYWFNMSNQTPSAASSDESASRDLAAPPPAPSAVVATGDSPTDAAAPTGVANTGTPTDAAPSPAGVANAGTATAAATSATTPTASLGTATAGAPPAVPTPPADITSQRPPPAAAPQRVATAPAASASAAARTSSPTRIEMAVDALDASPTDAAVHVTVHRKGNLHGATSFTWWTESGTAKPGVDFAPVLPHVARLQDGEASTVLTVPLIPTLRAQPKGFYVGIESSDGGAQIGSRSLTQITLPPIN